MNFYLNLELGIICWADYESKADEIFVFFWNGFVKSIHVNVFCINTATYKSNITFSFSRPFFRYISFRLFLKTLDLEHVCHNLKITQASLINFEILRLVFKFFKKLSLVFTFILMKLWLKLCYIFWLFLVLLFRFVHFIVLKFISWIFHLPATIT